jgi:hypothetical protein
MNDRVESRPIERNTVEGRQGVTGHNVRYVLTIGLASVIVLFAAVWLWFFG